VQHPGLRRGGALGCASKPCTPAGSMAAKSHGGTYSHDAVAESACGGERCAAAATAAAAARQRRATPTEGVIAPPRSAPAHGGRGGWRSGGRMGPTALRRADSNGAARWRLKQPTTGRNRSRRADTVTRGSSWSRRNLGSCCAPSPGATRGCGGGQGGRCCPGPCDPCGRAVFFSHVTQFAFSVTATLPTLTRPQIPEDTNAECHL